MQKINTWLIDGVGSIRGFTVKLGDDRETGIRTSPVVSRDGNVVTTKSGSQYELVDPPHWHMSDRDVVRLNFGGETDPLKAIDYRIANRDSE